MQAQVVIVSKTMQGNTLHTSFSEAADDCTCFGISLRCKMGQFPNGPRQIVSRDRVAHKSAEHLEGSGLDPALQDSVGPASSRPCCIAVRRDFADICRALMLGPSLAALRTCICMLQLRWKLL